jgi:peptidoglycan/xylan/chitin deacetylase (PgdA/CDA1 family)
MVDRPVERWRAPLAVRLSAGLHGTALGLAALHPIWWPQMAAAVVANHVVLGSAVLSPRSQMLGKTLYRLPNAASAIALTFDDGPDPVVTPHVLDLLAAFGAQASFFCIGERARRHPALVRQIAAAGHGVENHSLTHPYSFAFQLSRSLRREVEGAQAILADITGRSPVWFRSPMGFRNPMLDPVLCRAGLQQAAWTRRGYDTRCDDPALVLRRLLRGLEGGDVLMLHDGHAARTPDGAPVVLRVLPLLLKALVDRGFSVVSLPGARAGGAVAAGSRIPAEYASM